jgi:hypothetical protein
LPHSGIHGSKAIQRLTVAYRSRSRPSSTLGAKASTVCPYYLDGDQVHRRRPQRGPSSGPGDTRFSRRLSWRLMWLLCSFQGPRRGTSRRPSCSSQAFLPRCERRRTPVSQNSTACWTFAAAPPRGSQVARRRRHRGHPARFGRHARPGRPYRQDRRTRVSATPERAWRSGHRSAP